MDNRRQQCRYCHQEFEKQHLESHLRQTHSNHPDFQITCDVKGCQKVFRNLNSLRSHRCRQHFYSHCAIKGNESTLSQEEEEESLNDENNQIEEMSVVSDSSINDESIDDENEGNSNLSSNDTESSFEENEDFSSDSSDTDSSGGIHEEENEPNLQKMTLALMLLSMRAQCQVTNDIVLNVIKSLDSVVKTYVHNTLLNAETILKQQNVCNLSDFIDINREVAAVDTVQGLNSIYKQDSYFVKEFGVVNPSIIALSSEFLLSGRQTASGNQNVNLKKHEFVYISIHDVLHKFLSKDTFFESLQQRSKSKEGILSSFEDGTRYKEHPLFSRNSKAIQIKLYFDEVELCNGLGSKASAKQKVGFIYSQYGNLLPMHQSTWSSINLVAIIRYQDIKKFGLTQLAETIVKDVQEIEKGIELPDGNVAIGTASALSGDTLGIQMFCGFKESSTAQHPCRYCLASLEEIRIMIREDGQRLRSPSTHDEQIEKIETAATEEEKKILSQEYGINRSCPLRKLLGFHPTTSTPPDISHDLFAGIVILQIKLFLNRFCIKENWITLEDFNQRVADFDYGYSEKSAIPSAIKLAHISGKNNLRQTMSQSWMLAVILPFIVHDKINDENIHFLENHNQLLEIMAIVCSHTISLETLSYLESLIPLYLETFAQVYKDPESAEGRKFIPKQHFLVHYPRLIKIFGPLVHFWTLRFEAKHQFFKKIVQAMRNWKNVPITLSRKHQLWQALQWIASTNVEEISHGPKKCLTKSKTLFGHLFPSEETLWTVSWIELNHVKYTANQCYIPVGYENDLPLFAELHKIVWNNNNPIFVCKSVQTVQLDIQLMAYEIKTSNEYILRTPDSLASHNVFHCHTLNEKNYIIVKQLWFDLY